MVIEIGLYRQGVDKSSLEGNTITTATTETSRQQHVVERIARDFKRILQERNTKLASSLLSTHKIAELDVYNGPHAGWILVDEEELVEVNLTFSYSESGTNPELVCHYGAHRFNRSNEAPEDIIPHQEGVDSKLEIQLNLNTGELVIHSLVAEIDDSEEEWEEDIVLIPVSTPLLTELDQLLDYQFSRVSVLQPYFDSIEFKDGQDDQYDDDGMGGAHFLQWEDNFTFTTMLPEVVAADIYCN